MSYRHGVYSSEQATSLKPPVRIDTALPVVVGTAPVQTLEAGVVAPINSPKLIFDFGEFVRQFGSLPAGAKVADYTLYEFASIYLNRYWVVMVAWGNRTAAYPGLTDPKDVFIPIRRMFNFASNTLVTTAWQFLDTPVMRRRLVETICDTFNIWLNGLAAREYILGGRVEFQHTENPVTDLMDGIARFHVFFSPPPPAREIDFTLEYDPGYLANLFGVQE